VYVNDVTYLHRKVNLCLLSLMAASVKELEGEKGPENEPNEQTFELIHEYGPQSGVSQIPVLARRQLSARVRYIQTNFGSCVNGDTVIASRVPTDTVDK
jgi:hypothetical protein